MDFNRHAYLYFHIFTHSHVYLDTNQYSDCHLHRYGDFDADRDEQLDRHLNRDLFAYHDSVAYGHHDPHADSNQD